MPILDVSSDKFLFAAFPGTNPASKSFRLLNRGDGALRPAVTIPSEFPWLQVTLSGNQGKISIVSGDLPAGSYTGNFALSDPAAADSPRQIEVKLHVTSQVISEPSAVDLFLPPGRGGFRDLFLPVQSVPSGTLPDYRVRTQSGGNWLSGNWLTESGIYLRASVSASLAEGAYSGTVEFTNRSQPVGQVPIRVTVTSKPILAVDRRQIEVESSPGLDAPDQWIFVHNDGLGDLAWTPSAGASWLTAVQQNGALRIAFSSASLEPGTYQSQVEIRSPTAANAPLSLPITLHISARAPPAVKVGAAVDAANYCSRANCYLAPGSLVSLFGAQLAYATASATRLPLPVQLGATRVLVNGTAAELLYASYSQINLRLPATPPPGGRWLFVVEREGLGSLTVSAPYTVSAPSIFTADQSGRGYGALLKAGTAVRPDAANPAARGDYVEIYGTGLGGGKPTVLFYGPGITGNMEAEVSYAGPAPGFAGLDQINVRLPAALPPGDHLRLQIRTPFNLLSNPVELAVR